MNIVDRQAIEDLFRRLRNTETDSGPRDTEAETLIANLVGKQPAAPYYLAQTVLVQQWALKSAEERIAALEPRSGGILSALFGRRRTARPSRPARVPEVTRAGFLAGATQTALGVAGGFILHDMVTAGGFESAQAAGMDQPQSTDAGGGFGGDFGGGDFGGGFAGGGDGGGGG